MNLEGETQMDEKEQKILSLRYGLNGHKEQTQKQVADLLNISQSYISRIEKKILTKMKKDMSKLI